MQALKLCHVSRIAVLCLILLEIMNLKTPETVKKGFCVICTVW